MAENLKRFLIDLASDPERMKRYTANPAGELDGARLSTEERAALLAGDARSLRRALGASPVDHMTTMPGRKGGAKKGAAKKGVANTGGKKKGGKKSGRKK